jgi:hypothetical protein
MALEELRLYFQTHGDYKQRPSGWLLKVLRQGRQCTGVAKEEPKQHDFEFAEDRGAARYIADSHLCI